MVCQAWALQGYGAPLTIYGLYLLKIFFFVLAWGLFCVLPLDGVRLWDLSAWVFEATSFQKAILWSMAYECLGFGCGSGPLTGRYLPPFGGALHFLRPGTLRLPLFGSLPLFGGTRRSLLDVALYALHYVLILRALCAPELSAALLAPSVVLLPLMALRDKTLFLASRGEHYWVLCVCFLFGGEWVAAAIAVQVAIWMWAAFSKLNPHFPAVVCVMTSNSPLLRFASIRKAMYRRFPDDLRPSGLAVALAHCGTAVELCFPILLVFGDGGVLTAIGLVSMVAFHAYITSNFPMAVPIEWNVVVVYSGLFLFWFQSGVSVWDVNSAPLIVFLAVFLVAVPLVGNLWPDRVSFLLSMRYYAGNWAYSAWIFGEGGLEKLDRGIVKSSPSVRRQLSLLYDEEVADGLLSKVLAFRLMHLHGRALHALLPKAAPDLDSCHYMDGEVVAGLVLGWNFGDGHLHDERLMRAVQARCDFDPGQLRCIFVESQPLFGRGLKWRIVDANSGLIERGETPVRGLVDMQPWPSGQAPADGPPDGGDSGGARAF